MNPRLVAVAGPFQGASFPIAGHELSIGRDRSNTICLEDLAVSRRHALISHEGDRFRIRDLGSHNRTTVNGVPADDRTLQDGDEIRIGHSVFVLSLAGGSETPVVDTLLVDEGPADERTVILQRGDARYLEPERMAEACARPGGAQSLKCLLRISEAIASEDDLERLATRLLELAASVVPAERGAILLSESGAEDVTRQYRWSRREGGPAAVRVPRSIVRRVIAEHVSIWITDVPAGQVVASSESLVASRAASLLAVPFVASGRSVGAMYLDTTDLATRFTEDHLQLLTGVAGMAAGGLDRATRLEHLAQRHQRLQAESSLSHDMVGDGPAARRVYAFVGKVAPSESTVLLQGESGTGKELVARAVHRNSPRAARPFVAINCASLGDTLLESELFGHEKGAFTGAIALKKGKLEEAQGGTVFLDEVGELAPAVQARLLRVLQEREFERVGGTRPIKADIRLIAATNRDLRDEVRRGIFRQDLYFRLDVVSITLPPLRERREDIPRLASHFLVKHAGKTTRSVAALSGQALACLQNYEWPGNIRELENAIERALVLGSAALIQPDDLPEDIAEAEGAVPAPVTKFHDTIRQFKKQLVLKALDQAGGNYTEAAKILGLHPNNLHRLMTNLRLRAARS